MNSSIDLKEIFNIDIEEKSIMFSLHSCSIHFFDYDSLYLMCKSNFSKYKDRKVATVIFRGKEFAVIVNQAYIIFPV